MITQPTRRENLLKVLSAFHDEFGADIQWAEGQLEIIECVVYKEHPRNIIIAPTQYGKSLAVAIGLILRTYFYPDRFALPAPSQDKAQIIMSHVIDHMFDDANFLAQLQISEPLERLKRDRSKTHLTFRNGAEIQTFSADARNRQAVKKALMGFGAPNIIPDESALLPDDLYATVLRMLGGSKQNFLLEISNPWERNHFYRSWNDPIYHKIFIDYKRALSEGRYTPEFIEEMRKQPFFDVLYECRFPDETDVTLSGWRRIVTDTELEGAFTEFELEWQAPRGKPRLGVDVARGGRNFTVFVLRYDNVAKIIEKNNDADLMSQVARIKEYMEEYSIEPMRVFIDDVGVGGGITNRLVEQDFPVNGVSEGAAAYEKDKYKNQRSEMYWQMGQWIRDGGKLYFHDGFNEVREIHYKEDSDSRLKIEPKADMAKRGVQSPDHADALSLTFNQSPIVESGDFDFI